MKVYIWINKNTGEPVYILHHKYYPMVRKDTNGKEYDLTDSSIVKAKRVKTSRGYIYTT